MPSFWLMKTSIALRTIFILVAFNLLLFIGVASSPPFQAIHHHWIFLVLALSYIFQWSLLGGIICIKGTDRFLDLKTARMTILFIMAHLLLVGIARYVTVLTCFDQCGFKLGLTAILIGMVFFFQGRLQENHFWNIVRCQIVGFGAFIWAIYLFLHAINLSIWVLDTILIVIGLVFWLGRRNRARFIVALGIPITLLIRHTHQELIIILLSYLMLGIIFWSAKNWKNPLFSIIKKDLPKNKAPIPFKIRLFKSLFKITVSVALIVGFLYFMMGPLNKQMNPQKRRQYLLQAAAFKRKSPSFSTLSPLGKKLYHHVTALTQTIGDRSIYVKNNQKKTRDYIFNEFKKLILNPPLKPFGLNQQEYGWEEAEFFNIEVILGKTPSPQNEIWVVGAHYDTVPGTPGADDNASGVAILLELAHLLKEMDLKREIRLVAFNTEEPPSFGTRNMGSYQYAKQLKEQRVKLKAMISLEMLGYYHDEKNSQVYPPFLHLFYPNKGNFVSLVSNFKSRGVLKEFKSRWRSSSSFPLETVVLPGTLSNIALSDQLNFWTLGFPALMLSDTSFYRNPHYHMETDTIETLDFERMAQVTQALAQVLEEQK